MGGDWRLSLLLTFLLPLWISNFSASASPAPAFNGSFADKIHVDPSALKTNGSKGLNGSEIDCSQIVPPPIPGNWTPEYAQQWTKAHWDCSIPAFRDFRNESEELNNLSDQEVFHFTPENIARSNVRTWYMAWSRETLNDPTWNSTHWPEVALFARDFLHTRDYTCYISMKHCIHEPNFADIQMRFPGNENRALVQRIYLQMHMLTVLHNEKLQQLEAYDQAQGYLIGQAFMIITTFTKQVDQGAVTGCEVIKKVVDLAIQIGLSMANGAASAVSNALTAKGSLFEELASINVLDGKKFSNMGFGTTGMIDAKTGETMQKFGKMMRDDWSDAAKFDWFGTLQQQFWSGTDELIKKSYKQNVKSKVGGDGRKAPTCPRTDHLDPGMASDLMCAAFEGDGKDLNEANTHVLEKLMVKWFEGIRAETQKAHTKMYDGWIGTPGIGQPSMMAILFAMRDWPPLHGPGSSRHPLRNAAEYEEHIKFQALKHFLGVTMSDDGIYLYCMHLPDAEKQCAIDPDEKGKHHRGWWKDYRKAQICPRPKEDPTLICSAARWYHSSVMASHVTRMPGISLLESFDNEKWNLTVKGLLQEAYENYVLYRNNETGVNWVDPEEKAPVFSLPTCVNDNLLLHDYNPLHKTWHTPNASHLQFPSICGDWRGNETKGFMKKINLDPESKIYNTVDGSLPGFKHPNELFWDRIPRVSDV
ncbi:uncharacterized protein PAC_18382 [Phialocephala subalpina]|uniref:Uncharacterized protein n=1 Tax=Phialocephala subalpina TaxID=576137 RepID=A0A1L7XTX5_9HELO|nr:uncharacterized protein PAC_18382 [Phialocephala subalpina]